MNPYVSHALAATGGAAIGGTVVGFVAYGKGKKKGEEIGRNAERQLWQNANPNYRPPQAPNAPPAPQAPTGHGQ